MIHRMAMQMILHLHVINCSAAVALGNIVLDNYYYCRDLERFINNDE